MGCENSAAVVDLGVHGSSNDEVSGILLTASWSSLYLILGRVFQLPLLLGLCLPIIPSVQVTALQAGFDS